MHMNRKQSGFTLIEIVLVMILAGIVTVIASKIISTQLNSTYTNTILSEADAQVRIALDRMVRELRNAASSGSFTSYSNNTRVEFVNSDNETVRFRRAGSRIVRGSRALADNIQTMTIDYFDKNGSSVSPPTAAEPTYIRITITTRAPASFTVSSTAYIRNSE